MNIKRVALGIAATVGLLAAGGGLLSVQAAPGGENYYYRCTHNHQPFGWADSFNECVIMHQNLRTTHPPMSSKDGKVDDCQRGTNCRHHDPNCVVRAIEEI